ncbi:uncharacterized protein EAF02_012166 [Botrytis sinoallii]|uniref:uncharacterized protein n=1 Tax=Botrytis sinoallii TaxID=1463999 RepID=UPI0019011410|nr:uncharacterized protein EAF02_012166 [Botrytis sinoallii]KAF7852579.1 hypothetical protein EAF02_012166 [Botrytis sinoallii]
MSAPNEFLWLGKLFLFRLNNKVVDTYESCKKKILEKVNNKKVKKVDVEEVEVQEPTTIIHVRMQITKTTCPICGDRFQVLAHFRERLQATGGAEN